jgi:succinate semialdehyde reductase
MYVCKCLSKITGIPKNFNPTTFGNGTEMNGYTIISFERRKKLLHDQAFLTDIVIVEPYSFNTTFNVLRNSACAARSQVSEGYDSKLANPFTKLFCKEAFDILEDTIINDKHELLLYGACYLE